MGSDTCSAPVLAIDPGSDKCGIAVVSSSLEVLERIIVAPERVAETVQTLAETYNIQKVAIGNATTSRKLRQTLGTHLPHIEFVSIDEKNSTLEARALYWKATPPRGWRRFLPLSLQLPPTPIDDFAAVVLAFRFFENRRKQKDNCG